MLNSQMRIRVEWSHCDPARIIFNPHYYIWMDQGTHQLLTAAGFDFASQVGSKTFRGCPLVGSGANFHQPAKLGDVLTLTSWVDSFGTSSFKVMHRFSRADEDVADGHEVRVWASAHPDDPSRMKGTPVPDELRKALSESRTVDTSV